MAQPQLLQVKLSRFDAQPWGFRLQGGVDFAQPLLVQKVNAGSLSEQAGLQPGDAVIKINDVDVFNFRHKDAQDTVVRSGNNFVITVQRGGSTWRPQVTPTGNVPQANSPYLQTVTKTSLAHKQQDSQHIGCGYNNSARPFANGGGDGGVKSIVNKQYNTPVGIYSDESIAETLSAQAEVLAGGVLGVNFKKNEKEYQGDRSEVLKFLREEETGQSTPAFGNYEHDVHQQQQQHHQAQPQQQQFNQQQQYNQQQHQQQQQYHQQQQQIQQQQSNATRHVSAPVNTPKPPSTGGLPTGQNICTECERLITGVFVRIKDKNLHVECFKCATCGTSLKNQGYYNFNNKLYCDIHARQAAQNNPPAGTEGYVPIPIKPNTKLSANTISSALSSHGYGSNGYSNGNSTPAPSPPEVVEAGGELPLPPPPSPTQLLQYEAETETEEEPQEALPATAVQQPPHQQKQQQQHTRTHSSLSSISSGSSSSGVGGSGSASGAGHSQQSSSTLSLDLDRDRYAYGSPMHSRQTSGSSTSLDVSAVGGSGGFQADTYTMPLSPPPPPPPQPQTAQTPFRVERTERAEANSRVGAQNENDMKTQNKGHNAYNQLLKEYSNKLQHQHHHTNNNSNTTAHAPPRHNKTVAKPFATSSVAATTEQQPLVAALTATLANQLKFNSHQVASPQAALPTAAAAAATVVDSSSSNPTVQASEATAAGISSFTGNMSDEPSSIYGQMNAQPTAVPGDPAFEYVTLTGNVIRSVQAPGKGPGISYKVNQGYARPYGAAAGPPSAAPKSPVAYPPQQQQQTPRPAAGGNPYATLPRTNVGHQGASVEEPQGLQPEYEEEDCFEMDIEVALAASRQSQRGSSFTWPPPQDDSHAAPTAAPLYIPPPETQHVVVANPVQQVPPLPPGSVTARLDPQPEQVPQAASVPQAAPQWQSYSAPQLTNQRLMEQESSSDSYTSTSTTTTTTSEEYQRMYAAQAAAYQMQEQSGSEMDDYQVEYGSAQDVQEYASGRRSAQECVDSLSVPLSTYKLIDMVREVTPSPVSTPAPAPAPSTPQATRHVVFNDEPEYKELPMVLPTELETIPEAGEDREGLVIEHRSQILESERLFQPTPEIKFEIAPVRQIPPSKIPNPMPKEWINPMIRVLTTAPEVPFHLVECPFPRPCGDDFEAEAAAAEEAAAAAAPPAPPPPPPPPAPVSAPVADPPALLRESPPRGSRLTQAMVTAPEFELRFAPPADQGIPLPEETEPYMPPPMDMKPYMRDDYRPKSPFVSALTTAPDRPFEGHFDRDVPIHLIDLPTPKEHLSMCDALCTAPDRGYTPLNPENATHRVDEDQKQQELKKHEFQVLDHEEELGIRPEPPHSVEYFTTESEKRRKSSAFAAMQAFQPSREPLSSTNATATNTPRASICSGSRETETDLEYQKYCKAQQRNQKRLDFYHKKEEELQSQQTEQQLQQIQQNQRELQQNQINQLQQQQRESQQQSQQELQQMSQQQMQKTQQSKQQLYQTQQQQQISQQKIQQSQRTQQQAQQQTLRTQQQHQQAMSQLSHQQEQQQQTSAQQTRTENQTRQGYSDSHTTSLCSASASYSNSSSTVQQSTTNNNNNSYNGKSSLAAPMSTASSYAHTSALSKYEAQELIEETAEELEHSEILFPPPSPLSHLKGKAVQSGLHKADTIPKYQRNWTSLPTQSPIRTPEPQELRENVPLAFVDAPKAIPSAQCQIDSTVHYPIAQVSGSGPGTRSAPTAVAQTAPRGQTMPQPSVPIIIEDRSGPVTMAFQSLDEFDRPDQAQTPTRPFTPSMINKPAPIIPFYQTPEKLCFEECSATHARAYDQRALSPCFDRCRSPAPGPPPNPLSAIRAPRMKEPDSNLLSVGATPPRLQAGSITTGQSYQGQLLAHSEQSTQSGSQSFSQQPDTLTERQIGNLTVQQREQSSQLQQQHQAQSQSQTRTQVGNTQIERRRKVTEEFERTQSAKTIEIRTGSQSQSVSQAQSQSQSESTDRRSSYGKTGFVANQARRLSGLEQEITSLTSQSQAISARASAMGESNFPQLRSPTFDSKFPLKPASVESIVPGYGANASLAKKLAPPPGFLTQQQMQQQQSQQQRSAYSSSSVLQQQQQSTQSAFSSSTKATSSSLSSASAIASSSVSASASRSAQSASLTKASAITTTTNNQACSAFRSNVPGNGNNSKPNLASRLSIASITAQAPAPAQATAAPKSIITAAASAPESFPPNLSDLNLNSNVDGSAGGGIKNGKGGFGATSAPKRGRGILNQAAAPGVRIPLCNSCNVQIRGPFITALGRIWCPDHFICVNGNCRRPLQDIGFVEEKGDLYCEYCFEKYLAPTCSKCAGKIKGDCLNAIGKHFHPECFTCGQCGKVFGNRPFFLEDGNAYCEADWNELFTTKCFACGFPVEAGDRWVEALNHNYHSQCFNCTYCKQNLEGQSFYNKGGRPFCKNHAR
ncbi:PDZ and LIM domain protein Zasp isoform X1 [Drosophila persimilis]|uniref:PDZ and LIM domain protein Zasp isoform X1 n=1 Tax=Drosophila persimilis TaxID=7234 RepID=UPI000F07602D|nr:PDZ and LIM domain protein Zasp isoform X1 [Drosophila persimilis]